MVVELPENISSLEDIPKFSDRYPERIELAHALIQQQVSHTIFLIDEAVSAWESAGKSPESLRHSMLMLREFYAALCNWQKESMLAGLSIPLEKRVRLLESYIRMCARFEKSLRLLKQ